jgi:hypothetical protein
MPAQPPKPAPQWIGGIASLRGHLTLGGEPFYPDIILWLDEDGFILASAIGKPREALSLAATSLRAAITDPHHGPPRPPASIRIASADLADAVRKSHPAIEVICAPTPEIDAVVGKMLEKLDASTQIEPTYLAPGIDELTVRWFFYSAADLFRAAPWEHAPSDRILFAITIPDLGLSDAAVAVIGQAGRTPGLLVFPNDDAFAAFVEGAHAMERGEDPVMPRHMTLTFERGAEMIPALRKEIAAHGWPVADAHAHPWVAFIDEDFTARPPTRERLEIVGAIVRALTELLRDPLALARAWAGGEQLTRTLFVDMADSGVVAAVRAPYARGVEPDEGVNLTEILAQLDALVPGGLDTAAPPAATSTTKRLRKSSGKAPAKPRPKKR